MEKSFWIMALLVPFLGGACNGTGGEELLAQFTVPQLYEGEVDENHLGIGVSEVEDSFVAVVLERCGEDELCAQFEFVGTLGFFAKELEGPYSEWVENIQLTEKGISLVFTFDYNDDEYSFGINGKFVDEGIESVIHVSILGDLVPLRVGRVMLDHVGMSRVQ